MLTGAGQVSYFDSEGQNVTWEEWSLPSYFLLFINILSEDHWAPLWAFLGGAVQVTLFLMGVLSLFDHAAYFPQAQGLTAYN